MAAKADDKTAQIELVFAIVEKTLALVEKVDWDKVIARIQKLKGEKNGKSAKRTKSGNG